MKQFFIKYYKDILLLTLTIILTIILIKIFRPIEDRSELLKYKLEQLDQNINKMKQLQLQLNDSISTYKKDIEKIDENISKIKTEKTTINNFYEQKKEEINGMTKKEIDSSFKQRYKY
jgi:septal ring factor EnvC (AmiA/AmiB activator)